MSKPETNRRKLIRLLEAAGWRLEREGGEHAIYVDSAGTATVAVPRHNELSVGVARQIIRTAGL